jgi:hypothetical protein
VSVMGADLRPEGTFSVVVVELQSQ